MERMKESTINPLKWVSQSQASRLSHSSRLSYSSYSSHL
nr:MAG TPA: hypothetical protein [Caudoviricetes sp.]